jgi:glycosyltransferase involved in cell wall biosynthesis
MVTPRYLPHIGGVERHVHEVAMRLAAAGVDVTVLTTDPEGRLPASEQEGAVRVLRVRAYPGATDWHIAPGLAGVIARGGWDVVHVQSYHTFVAPLAMGTAARCRIPYVVTFHGGGHSAPWRNRVRVAQRGLLRPLLARAAALVAVARFEIDEYSRELRIAPERFTLIPNGIDLPAATAPVDDASAHPLIASIGRLERYKGHQRVIAALPLVRADEPSARLWIAGSGPYERDLRELAGKLGVAGSVEIGAVAAEDRAEMARRLAQADVVVLLSDFETHPIAALEAIALGRPLVVASGSGLGELAERGLARAVAADAPPELIASAILRELRDPLVRSPVVLPTWDDCAAALLALYGRILGGRA